MTVIGAGAGELVGDSPARRVEILSDHVRVLADGDDEAAAARAGFDQIS